MRCAAAALAAGRYATENTYLKTVDLMVPVIAPSMLRGQIPVC